MLSKQTLFPSSKGQNGRIGFPLKTNILRWILESTYMNVSPTATRTGDGSRRSEDVQTRAKHQTDFVLECSKHRPLMIIIGSGNTTFVLLRP